MGLGGATHFALQPLRSDRWAAALCCAPSLLPALVAGAAGILGLLALPLLALANALLLADVVWLRVLLRRSTTAAA